MSGYGPLTLVIDQIHYMRSWSLGVRISQESNCNVGPQTLDCMQSLLYGKKVPYSVSMASANVQTDRIHSFSVIAYDVGSHLLKSIFIS